MPSRRSCLVVDAALEGGCRNKAAEGETSSYVELGRLRGMSMVIHQSRQHVGLSQGSKTDNDCKLPLLDARYWVMQLERLREQPYSQLAETKRAAPGPAPSAPDFSTCLPLQFERADAATTASRSKASRDGTGETTMDAGMVQKGESSNELTLSLNSESRVRANDLSER